MTQVPPNFPTYSSYSPKTLIQQVDVMKECLRELQQEIAVLKAAQPTAKADKKLPTKDQ